MSDNAMPGGAGLLERGLSATGVTVRYGGHRALDGVTLHAPRPGITGLIGPNGAGKTTFFDACCGFVELSGGTISLDGTVLDGLGAARRAQRGIGRTFQRLELFNSMTVRQNVELAVEAPSITGSPLRMLGIARSARARRRQIRERADELLARFGLADVADRIAGELSTGRGRQLELARAVGRQPAMLLLDEPSSGLDGRETDAFGEILVELARSAEVGLLLVEHDMKLAFGICDQVHVLDFGRTVAHGTPQDIASNEDVRRAYLGTAA